MNPKSRTAQALQICASLFFTFSLLRLFYFPLVFNQEQVPILQQFKYLFVGLMSDFWVAVLWMLIFILLSWIIGAHRSLYRSVLTFISLLSALAIAYIAFFRHPIHPFHLTYLLDLDFIKANAGTSFDLKPITLFLITLAFGLCLDHHRITMFRSWKPWTIAGVVSLGLIAHASNIRYRVQWFVPESLQVNSFEHLYLKFKLLAVPPAIASTEWELIKLTLPTHLRGLVQNEKNEETKVSQYLKLEQTFVSPELEALKQTVRAQQDPIIIVYLAESQRPADRSRKDSLMPHLDNMITTGVNFQNAFSSGNVTRAAQESILCGYPSGFSTSTMRGQTEVNLACISSMRRPSPNMTFLWLHGGDAGFDNQAAFWKQQKFDLVMSRTDFPKETASTGWGVSDLALARRSTEEIRSNATKGPLFAFILSATNHIPWAIPSDKPKALGRRFDALRNQHKSYATTLYADHAIGELVSALKKDHLWERTLFIVASDHGHLVPAQNKNYKHDHLRTYLRNHVHLVLSGGITENLRKQNILARSYQHMVTLHDLGFALKHLISDQHGKNYFGVDPFLKDFSIPKFVDNGESIYFPDLNRSFTKRELIEKRFSGLSNSEILGMMSYITFLRWGFHASF